MTAPQFSTELAATSRGSYVGSSRHMKRSLMALLLALSPAACTDSGAESGPSGQTSGPSVMSANSITTSNTVAGDITTGLNGGTTTNDDSSMSTAASGSIAAGSNGATTASGTIGSGGATTGSTNSSEGSATADNSSAGGSASSSTGGGGVVTPAVLIFSRTTGYRHVSIEAGVQALEGLARERGWSLSATEDPAVFSDAGLESYNVIVFLNTNDEVLDEHQQAALEAFIRSGKGYVGVHSASATEYEWAWYGRLVGAYFNAHPDVQPATVVVEDTNHPSTAHLSGPWTRTDEWYGFVTNPRNDVHVLLSLDEQSYAPGAGAMGSDHPIAWYHEYDGGRSFYTGLGHTNESYAEVAFLEHIAGGIEWASSARQ
jgi:type 1 glutamine amidotransferase